MGTMRVHSVRQGTLMATAEEDEAARERDDVRCEAALSTLEDVLWRFNETMNDVRAEWGFAAFDIEKMPNS